MGINASGQVVGYYYDQQGRQNGFLYNSGKYTTIDDPLGDGTQLTGINAAHQIVGDYFDSKGTEHGFVYSDGKYTTIDPTGSTKTTISGINNAGQVVGTYTDQIGTHAFIASPQTEDRERKEPLNIAALFDQYVAAGFHNDHDGAGQMTSLPDKQGHQENLTFLSNPHHHG